MKMTKVLTATVMATLIAGGAMAGPGKTGNPGKGNQGCILGADNSYHKNPGKMMQYIRNNDEIGGHPAGGNANDWLDNFPGFTGTVGDWINRNCGFPEPS